LDWTKILQNNHILKIRDLQVKFHTDDGTLCAVDGVSIDVEKGKILGIVGESGCGKSVTALSIMRLVPCPPGEITGGEIIWKGKNLFSLDYRELPAIRGSEIAMIFQEPMTSLNPVFTVGKQLGEVLKLRFGMKGELAHNRIVEMLDMVGISDPESRINSYPHELSGGMMQRVMIAMALLCEPDLLIADEPTTALDVTIQAQILQLMKDLQAKTGMSIILITHNMGVVAEMCQDVIVMYAGQVIEKSNVSEIFKKCRHPYTRGLLDSIPKKGYSRNKALPTIEGTVPSLMNLPPGCRFAGRCNHRKKLKTEDSMKCMKEMPLLRKIFPEHEVACHFPI
jgi:oligopeptide/dipeptide ABC transporter ATP-binding protein